MIKYVSALTLFLTLVLFASCGPSKTKDAQENSDPVAISSEIKVQTTSQGPKAITRTILQDKNGDIWIATFEGVYRYDNEQKNFINLTSEVSSARFFSILEDSKGAIWLGSIGSGVYYYDGEGFQNFTTEDGLLNNEVTSIYEDKSGNIWLGVNGGLSRFDPSAVLRKSGKVQAIGESILQNFIIEEDSIREDHTGKIIPDFSRPPNEVTSIVEDKTGNLWVATRGNTFIYDREKFTPVTYHGKPFKNVRSLLKDSKGNIWLGGNDGLWRYEPSASLSAGSGTFTNFSQNFVGYMIEDSKGDIWMGSEGDKGWILSRYEGLSLSQDKIKVAEINPIKGKMLFGMMEANDGSMWVGSLDGVYRFDPNVPVEKENTNQ
ncbi:ligand-binding sensor domain-containing protein [Algoriphagus machipongonensis]|uniref:GGDEF domain protein n=1 Tax=Algoriphagus machipongonensis TaxID=388413 RepID=A3I0C8_9BACT|nr:two-component regulator propeller domain-containing protein [Algoriphagus machipongonensis]EAZ79924.1 putative GGDEF domain protein [Algoriphagus machipongonensis]